MSKFFILIVLVLLIFLGYVEKNGLPGTITKNNHQHEKIASGLSPEDVVKLYLTYTGKGEYVMAYDLMTDEQKRQQTADDVKKYSELGKVELEKVIGVQEKDGVSLVTAAVKYTDQKTQKARYQVKEFILTKDNEWRLLNKDNLDHSQLETINGLVVKQADAIKNSPKTKEYMEWMKQKNSEVLGAAKDSIFEQTDNLKGELTGVIDSNKESVKSGIQKTVDSAKDGITNGADNIKNILFGQ